MNINDILDEKSREEIDKKIDEFYARSDWYPDEVVVTGPFYPACSGGSVKEETDPIFSASPSATITNEDIDYWNNKSNFSGSYNDLTDKLIAGPNITIDNNNVISSTSSTITETDPIFINSPAHSITEMNITEWNNKSNFSGDYNDLTNKLTAGTNITISADNVISSTGGVINETDPIFTESPAFLITDEDLENWNGKQEQLISGVNIKTINNTNILGEGNYNIPIPDTTDVRINNTSITNNAIANISTEGIYNADTNKLITSGALEDKIQELIGTIPGAIDYLSYNSTETLLNPMTNIHSDPGVITIGKTTSSIFLKISPNSAAIVYNNRSRLFVGNDLDNNIKVFAYNYKSKNTVHIGEWLFTAQQDGSLILGGE